MSEYFFATIQTIAIFRSSRKVCFQEKGGVVTAIGNVFLQVQLPDVSYAAIWPNVAWR